MEYSPNLRSMLVYRQARDQMTIIEYGSQNAEISTEQLESFVEDSIAALGNVRSMIALPPDITRFHSRAGLITDMIARIAGPRLTAVMPALGTHVPMTAEEIHAMYPGTPKELFRNHDWRNDVTELARLDADFVREVSENTVSYDYPVQANKLLVSGAHDAIISIGQVVPHEVVGMANHAKNIFVGTGGKEAIDKSHFLGAAYGMERMMGRADTPVRAVFNKALEFASPILPPILWILTVVGRADDGRLVLRGFFSGTDNDCFYKAARLSAEVNITKLDAPIAKAIVWLDPSEFRSTWLGNKAVYRTRMAMADGGELIVLAPGLAHFGEDAGIDALIRKYGYRTSAEIRKAVQDNADLAGNLSAAAHLIHGSSENRFSIRYAPGPSVSKTEIESVGYGWADLERLKAEYAVENAVPGWNRAPSGEPYFFVPNPALGLWTTKERFSLSPSPAR